MDPDYVHLYLRAMRDEAMTATFAYNRIEQCVHRLDDLREATAHLFTEGGKEHEEILGAIENEDFWEISDVEEDLAAAIEAFLSAQARLSLFVAPSPAARVRARVDQRAAILRACLGLKEGDDLGDRGLRNAWMHIDESIDSFVFEKAEEANLVIRHVGRPGGERQRVLRLIDPSGLQVWMLGEQYSLREISYWVDDMERRLALAMQKVEGEIDGDRSDPK